jgi:histidyl-tRNA synthetase
VREDRALLEGAPTMLEHLCAPCAEHFEGVQGHLRRLGVDFTLDPRLVRGLDYYVRTAFEITAASGLGAQNSLMGGGRYDGLVKELGGPDLPGFGWALGLERLMLLLDDPQSEGAPQSPNALTSRCDLFVAHMGDAALAEAIGLTQALRARGVSVRIDPRPAKLGAQLKRADREGAAFSLILGDDELAKGTYQLKDMQKEVQEPVDARDRGALIEALARRTGHAQENR